jgi:photosystem II stability/assembly factor-like uncharacterized protein
LLRSSDGAHFLAGTSAGVFTQTADKWSASSSGLPNGDGVDALAFAGTGNATWLAGTELHGVYRSTDGGKTWTAATGLPGNADVYALTTLSDNQTVYAALIGAGIYRSKDGGQTWAAVTGGLPAKTDAFAIVPILDSKNKLTALLAGTSDGAWRSTDGGATWAAANSGLPKTRVISLATDTHTAQLVVAGTDAGVYFSSTGGTVWGTLAKGLPSNQHIGSVAFTTKGGNYVYAAADVLYRYPGSTNSSVALVARVAFLGALVTAFIWISTRQRGILRAVAPKLPPELERPGAAGRLRSTNRPKPTYTPGMNSHIRGGPPPKVPDEVDETADATNE